MEQMINENKIYNAALLQYNLYTYCLNNPVNRIDENGNFSLSIFTKGASLITTGLTAIMTGAAVVACGGWLAANKPRISAYNNIQDYNYTKTISDAEHMNRPYNNSVLLQKQIIKYGKMTKDSGGFGYIFTASGAVNKTTKTWCLGVNVAKRLVWHFGHGF